MVTERPLNYPILPNPGKKEKTSLIITPELLVNLYWRQEMNMERIGALLNRDPITIGRYFKKFKIEVRSPQESHRLSWRDPEKRRAHAKAREQSWQRDPEGRERQRGIAKELFGRPEIRAKKRATVQQKAHAKMKQALGVNPEKTLKQLIQKERLNIKQIAQKLKVSRYQVTVWKNFFGIEPGRIYHPQISQVNKDIFQKSKKTGLLEKLTLNQRSVLEKRYGKRPVSLEEIAKSRNVTRQAVNLIERRAIKKLQKLLAS